MINLTRYSLCMLILLPWTVLDARFRVWECGVAHYTST